MENKFSAKLTQWKSMDTEQRNRLLIGRTSSRIGQLVRTVFLFCMCFVVLYPMMYMVSVSLRAPSDLYDPTVIWIPKSWTLDNYQTVINTMQYVQTLMKTVLMSALSTLLNVSVCAVIGYGFARFRFPFRNIIFGIVIFTIIVPPQNVAIPLFVQYQSFDFLGLGQLGILFTGKPFTVNLLNTPLTLYIPAALGMGIRSGLFIYIFRQFFRGIPKELEEAAYIDGCGVFRTFVRIMLINAVPAIISCVLFSFVWYWNDYFLTSMFFNDPQTLSTTLGTLQGTLRSMGMDFYANPYIIVAQMQAACVLVILPLLAIYVLLQRYFTESIDKTGIVG